MRSDNFRMSGLNVKNHKLYVLLAALLITAALAGVFYLGSARTNAETPAPTMTNGAESTAALTAAPPVTPVPSSKVPAKTNAPDNSSDTTPADDYIHYSIVLKWLSYACFILAPVSFVVGLVMIIVKSVKKKKSGSEKDE